MSAKPYTEEQLHRQLRQGKQWLLGLLVLAMLVYQLSIKKTLHLIAEKKQLQALTASYTEWQYNTSSAETTLPESGVEGEIQHALFANVSAYARQQKLTIENLSPPHIYTESGLRIHTFSVAVSGPFKPMLQLIHSLECEFAWGKVSGYQFSVEQDPQTRKERLVARILVQSLSATPIDESEDKPQ
jgi:hypothetical protein